MPLAPAAKRRLRRVRGLIAQELVEVTAVCHLPEPGKSTQPHMALTYFAERRVNGVFLGLGSEDIGGHG